MSGGDPIEALAHTLDALDAHLIRSERTLRRSESNRMSMLHVHAVAAVLIGVMFAAVDPTAMSGSTWLVLREVPGAPVSLAALLGVGGIILGIGTWRRHVPSEVVGLTMLLSWYVVIAAGFAGSALLWLTGLAPPGPRPAMYAALVYAHLAVIMAVHLRTLRRMHRRRQ